MVYIVKLLSFLISVHKLNLVSIPYIYEMLVVIIIDFDIFKKNIKKIF